MNTLLGIQGIFYLFTGLWPILHYKSFEKVTGPKTDIWLVVTVGWLITVSSVVFIYSAFNNQNSQEIYLLAALEALMFCGVDTYYVVKKVISKAYLFDAVAEGGLALSWGFLYFLISSA